ncbi:MAG: ribosome silencing factor [Halomonadaceae bacterium]|nr:MAG: ribosome silencing factor [Halomonadaceae bacterium]
MQADALKELISTAVSDRKGEDIVVLDVRDRTSVADYMIIASGTSKRHIYSIAEHVVVSAKSQGNAPPKVEGGNGSDWVLVDLGDVILHVMLPAAREFYDLERFWRDAPGLEMVGPE